MKNIPLFVAAVLCIGAAPLRSDPELGKAEGQCRTGEAGPAFLVSVTGLKDHQGRLKLEVYPDNDTDFLADDNILIQQGKTFRRVEVPVPADPVPQLCIRVPRAGNYTLTLLHDRDSNRKFGLSIDGIGFSANPKLGWSRPKAATVRVTAEPGPTAIRIVMNYRRGLMSFGPLARHP
jgi:uncharacterized protein (DUF2141 family)